MKVLGKKVLVLPEESTSHTKLVVSQSRKGEVVTCGDDVKGLFKTDKVIFGDEVEKISLSISGQPKEYYLMDVENIKLVMEV